ncbi:TetR/AcrR family transcriptional regulator [Paractinoplanes hotanensis]|uniref:TetR family transcriptional regulator n=1 Tax=Paractinoplanes hotanensis TaxID=2906497 RepID=A0ABT0YB00_9ACTN|nr:TetR family transcriptional regulator [Actinoplanes hotanensis]MCM4083217.1 TetR family transcriptional regulator [Actinoplanes hotanensis]
MALRDVRQQLFDAAQRVLLSDGPSALTSRAVTTEAGCAKGVLHRHFADFDDFLAELVRRRIAGFEAWGATMCETAGSGPVDENIADALTFVFDPVGRGLVALILSRDDLRARLRSASRRTAAQQGEATRNRDLRDLGLPIAGLPAGNQPPGRPRAVGQPTEGQWSAGLPTAGQRAAGQPAEGQRAAGQPTRGRPGGDLRTEGLPLLDEASAVLAAYLTAEQAQHRVPTDADIDALALTLVGAAHLAFAGGWAAARADTETIGQAGGDEPPPIRRLVTSILR